MNDDAGVPDVPLIDVRSPAERWTDSGRAGIERLRRRVEGQRLDAVALVWMVLVLAITGADIYSAVRLGSFRGFPGTGDWWYKLQILAQESGGITVFGGAVGIALAVLFRSATSRLALVLAAIGGVIGAITGLIGVVVTFHHDHDLPQPLEGQLTGAVVYLGYGALGVVIATIAWQLSRSETG